MIRLSGLKLLEYHANVTVYPRLEMTAKLLQLAAFKKALEDAPYVPLAEKREDDEAMKTEQEQSHSPMQVTEEQKSTESVVQTESSSAAVKADTDVEMKQAEDDAAEQEEDDSNSSSESEAFNSPIVPVHLGSIEDRIRSCGTVHSFYRKGEYLFATVSDHVSAEEEEEKKSRRELGKAVCVDVIGSEHISFTVHHCQLALPHIIDFSVHLLAQAEKFCGLVSELGIVRVDVDMQVIECEEDEKESELIVTLPDEWKKNWQTTGKGFIVGFRFKNMTKDLDVRCQ
jgi:hypothetical protein